MNLVALAIGLFLGNMLGARYIRRLPWKDSICIGALTAFLAVIFVALFVKST